jgi:hypothetical protein
VRWRQAVRRECLELVRDDVATARKLGQRGQIFIARIDLEIGHGASGAIRLRLEHMHAVAHGLRGLSQHATELAATEDTESFAGREDGGVES